MRSNKETIKLQERLHLIEDLQLMFSTFFAASLLTLTYFANFNPHAASFAQIGLIVGIAIFCLAAGGVSLRVELDTKLKLEAIEGEK